MKIYIPEQTFDIGDDGYGRIRFDLQTNETPMPEEVKVDAPVEEAPVEAAPEVAPEVPAEVPEEPVVAE